MPPVLTFRVDLQQTKPTPSWTAWRRWQSGVLTVHEDRAEFDSRSGSRLTLSNVVEVTQPSRRQLRRDGDIGWMVNGWVTVHYVSSGERRVAYLASRSPWGFGHYLSHNRLRHALEALVPA